MVMIIVKMVVVVMMMYKTLPQCITFLDCQDSRAVS